MKVLYSSTLLAFALITATAAAMPTENQVILALPAPGEVAIDGSFDDWDLTGGVFSCGDVYKERDDGYLWVHLMYDAEYLYVLARVKDATPLENYRRKEEGQGWHDDNFQFRLVTDRTAHVTTWQDRNGEPVMDIYYGTFAPGGEEGTIDDALAEGALMAFKIDDDGKGYVQEIALPWSLITRSGQPLTAGQSCTFTYQVGLSSVWNFGDLYSPGANKGMAWQSSDHWGAARFMSTGKRKPQNVRLADGREFPVRMTKGAPVVNWDGLTAEAK